MVGGALLALARPWPGYLWDFIKRQSMVSLDIPDKSPAFQWVDEWLSNHPYSKKRARSLTVKCAERDEYEICHKPKIMFSPAPGSHYLWYKRRLVILSRNRQGGQSKNTSLQDPFREHFTLRVFGRNRSVALSLIEDAYEAHNPSAFDRLVVHRASRFGVWESLAWVPARPFSSVILPIGVTEQFVNHLQDFITSEEWYLDRGIPYRTGCLCYGPTGNGKTSAIVALASQFGYDIALLNLKASDLSDEDLSRALAEPPPKSFIVLEDIDCVVKGREVQGNVSFSGLLNALDGIGAAHNQIVFMTTNHIESLDSALIRPGRCDLQIEFPNATKGQKSRLFERFFPGTNLGKEFASKSAPIMSMATLQKHMVKYRHDANEAFEQMIDAEEIIDD